MANNPVIARLFGLNTFLLDGLDIESPLESAFRKPKISLIESGP